MYLKLGIEIIEYNSKEIYLCDIASFRAFYNISFWRSSIGGGFLFKPPSIELILKNNKTLLIHGEDEKDIELLRKLERKLKEANIKKVFLTKLDVIFLIVGVLFGVIYHIVSSLLGETEMLGICFLVMLGLLFILHTFSSLIRREKET